MPTVEQFLESIGRGTSVAWTPADYGVFSFAEDWDTADSTRNVLLFPEAPPRARSDVLAALRGGLVTDSSLRARVSAIVGPGATVRGIAERAHPVFTAGAAAANPAPTVEEVAQALLVYSEFYLPVPALRNYADGLRIPLPIEIDQAGGDWVVNGNTIRLWARSFQPAWRPQLDRRPARLAQPDAAALAKEVEQFLKDQKTPLARGLHLLARVLTNPFREVFFFFEAMKQLPTPDRFPVALCFLDNAVNHQMALLATLTAGHAILKRVERVLRATLLRPASALSAPQTASRTRGLAMLAAALRPGGLWVVHRELPETPQQLADQPGTLGAWQHVQADDPTAKRHRMVLGRDVLAGEIASVTKSGQTFRGPAYGGRIEPGDFIDQNHNLLNESREPMLTSRLFIVRALTVNLGFLDAVRMRGRGILSAGVQGWSADDDQELPSLLQRYASMDEDGFDLFFGIYGLGVRSAGEDAKLNEKFMLQRVEPSDAKTDLVTPDLRRDFFGGSRSGTTTTFETHWAARCREAAIASWSFRASQIWEATSRFDRVLRDVGTLKVGRRSVSLNILVTSQLGVALILDAHMIMPGNVRDDLQKAVSASGVLDDDAMDEAITRNYRNIRRTNDTPGRNKKIDALGLSVTHRSFGGW